MAVTITPITKAQYDAGFKRFVKLTCPRDGDGHEPRHCNPCGDAFDDLITAMHLELDTVLADDRETVESLHGSDEYR